MTEPVVVAAPNGNFRLSDGVATPADEPVGALVVGGALGALAFALTALLFGATAAIVLAVVAALVAFVSRRTRAAIAFVAAGVIAAFGLAPSTAALFVAAAIFGVGLGLAARGSATKARVR